MSTIKANIIDSTTTSTDFKEKISATGDPQWLDTYGVIKTNRDTIAEDEPMDFHQVQLQFLVETQLLLMVSGL